MAISVDLTMSLLDKQRRFVQLIGRLILWAYDNGYELTFGEAVRTQAQAAANAAIGIGLLRSLHLIRLAVDFNLFVNGEYRTDSESYKPLGTYWKTLDPLCCWGGDFSSKPDGNHFSLTHNGVK